MVVATTVTLKLRDKTAARGNLTRGVKNQPRSRENA